VGRCRPRTGCRTIHVDDNLWNQAQWGQDKILRSWIRQSRLDGFGKLMTGIDPNDSHKQAIMVRLKDQAMAAMANLPKLS
jgi:hypothetical protein